MGLTQLLSIVLHETTRWDQLILVISALDGITDQLIEASQFARLGNTRGYRRIVATLRTRHISLIGELPLGATERAALQTNIDLLLFEMHDACQRLSETGTHNDPNHAFDQIIGTGERLAARIVAALLRQHNIRAVALDATDLIITDDVRGYGTPMMAATQGRIDENLKPLMQRQILPVITGFIAATPDGAPTTLGRGGSDYTASLIATCVNANEVRVYADVDGMMTADPNDMPDAHVIDSLSYEEAADMAFYGARILHARMIAPLYEQRIPLRIKNVFKPQHNGTLIDARSATKGIKAITMIEGLALTAPRNSAFDEITDLIDQKAIEIAGARVEMVTSAQSATHTLLCFMIPPYAGHGALHMLQSSLVTQLTHISSSMVWSIQAVAIITVVGNHSVDTPDQIARILTALGTIRLLTVARNPSNCSLSLVIHPADADHALNQIHTLIVSTP